MVVADVVVGGGWSYGIFVLVLILFCCLNLPYFVDLSLCPSLGILLFV